MKNLSINWRTTLAAVIAVAVQILPVLFPTIITPTIANSISVLAGAAGLIAAKDGVVTGIGAQATTVVNASLPLADALTANSSNVTIQDIHKVIDALKPSQAPVTVNVTAPATPTIETGSPVINQPGATS